jgi:CDP-glucose 4,6-dehydratase
MLGRRLLEGDRRCAGAWNFGPPDDGSRTVLAMVEELRKHWPEIEYDVAGAVRAPHEATLLKLDCSKARTLLGWRPVWDFAELAKHTAEWYRHHNADGVVDSARQLDIFRSAASALLQS